MNTIRKTYQSAKRGQVHYAEAGEGFPLLLLGETPHILKQLNRHP